MRSNAEPLAPFLAGTSAAVESGPLLSKHEAVARRRGTGSRAFSARRTMTAITIRHVAQQQSGPVPNLVGRRTDPRLARASLRGWCPGQRRGVPWVHMPPLSIALAFARAPWASDQRLRPLTDRPLLCGLRTDGGKGTCHRTLCSGLLTGLPARPPSVWRRQASRRPPQ
jgi:hypothetical protein